MPLDPASCYRALQARDSRFDGVFFIAVKTTGVYCRPVCPARLPAPGRCVFFERAAEAERAGFRACFRCRPELAPGLSEPASVDALDRLVLRAARRIDAGYLNEASVDDLAAELGVSARHLRRSMEARLGVTPSELAQTRRLALAKHLLQDGHLPLAQVAFASGFASVRRFNGLFRSRFGRSPSELRRRQPAAPRDAVAEPIGVRLDYRPPLAWDTLLAFLAARAIPGVERVADGEYRRTIVIGERTGSVRVRRDPGRNALAASVSLPLAPVLPSVVARLRALFDLDARPAIIAEHLGQDPLLRRTLAAHPGLRVPGAFDAFEMAVRAILGQQVSVAAATTVAGRLVQRFGTPPSAGSAEAAAGIGWTFPGPARLAQATIADIARLGMPRARAQAILALAQAVASGHALSSSGEPPEHAIERLVALPGIGVWTATYIALRALRWPDAFVASDLGVRHALGVTSARAAEERAARWRPWRAYAVVHLWTALTDAHEKPANRGSPA